MALGSLQEEDAKEKNGRQVVWLFPYLPQSRANTDVIKRTALLLTILSLHPLVGGR